MYNNSQITMQLSETSSEKEIKLINENKTLKEENQMFQNTIEEMEKALYINSNIGNNNNNSGNSGKNINNIGNNNTTNTSNTNKPNKQQQQPENYDLLETIYHQNKKLLALDLEITSISDKTKHLKERKKLIAILLNNSNKNIDDLIEELGARNFFKITNGIIVDNIDSTNNLAFCNKDLLEKYVWLCEEYKNIMEQEL